MSSLAKFTHAEVKGGFVATKGIFKSQLSIGADGNIVGNLIIRQNLVVHNALIVKGDTIFKNLNLSDNLTVSKNIFVSGNLVGKDELNIVGNTQLNNTTIINANLIVKQNIIVHGKMNVLGTTEFSSLSIRESLSVGSDVVLSGNLTVIGNTTHTNIQSETVAIGDNMIQLNSNLVTIGGNTPQVDFGFYGQTMIGGDITYTGIAWDESANTFSFVDTSEDGTTAGNVSITDYENLRVGALTADDASTLATGSTIGNLTLANGSITDSSGAISFGDENLSTTGTFSAEHLTSTDDLTVSGLATIGETLGVTGIATFTAQSVHNGGLSTGALVMNDGSITDTSGAISFGDENLTTSGTLGAGVITATGFTIGSAVITEAELEILDGASLSTTELNYVNGVTSAIQTQIDTKAPLASPTFTGTITIGSAGISETELEILDGLTVTTDELNIMDGSATTQATVTLAGTDGVVISDGDVMKQALVSDFEVYMEANLDTMGSQFTSASALATVGTIGTGVWQGTAVASAYLDADTAHLSGTQTFTGDKTFSDNVIITTADDDTTTALKVLALDDAGYTGTVMEVYGTRGPTTEYNIAKFGTNASTPKIVFDGEGKVAIGHTTTTGASLAICDGANAQIQFFPEISTDTNLTQHYDITSGTYMNAETRSASHSFKIGTTEKMRIDSSGNVLLMGADSYARDLTFRHGPTNPNHYWRMGYTSTSNGNTLAFINRDGSAEQEVMRMDWNKLTTFSGALTVNTRIKIDASGHAYCYIDSGSTSHASWVIHQMANSDKWYSGVEGNSGNQYRIYDAGDGSIAVHVQTGGTSWVANSDERMKKDIVLMENRLDDLLKIKVRRFKWKHSDKEDVGFIAQELETCVPDAVEVGSDEVYSKEEADANLTAVEGALKNPYGVSREMLIPMMIKSIQELSAKVEALENA